MIIADKVHLVPNPIHEQIRKARLSQPHFAYGEFYSMQSQAMR